MSGRPAVFLDRDGTLNEAVGFVNHVSRFRPFPWVLPAIRAVREEGYLAIVVTNQSGIARGLFDENLMHAIHDEFRTMLKKGGAELDGIYFCPHAPWEDCECRKPKSGMLRRAADDLGVDLARSWIVGDGYTDLEAGWAAGARAALVLTGSGRGALEHDGRRWERFPDVVAPDLHRAVCSILWGALD
ncbi:MAG TPA: HAD family hydrolase [Vicinamibacteria bacterium]|nr:HAD family hydrolase [Vicinamibacteria bacterium]